MEKNALTNLVCGENWRICGIIIIALTLLEESEFCDKSAGTEQWQPPLIKSLSGQTLSLSVSVAAKANFYGLLSFLIVAFREPCWWCSLSNFLDRTSLEALPNPHDITQVDWGSNPCQDLLIEYSLQNPPAKILRGGLGGQFQFWQCQKTWRTSLARHQPFPFIWNGWKVKIEDSEYWLKYLTKILDSWSFHHYHWFCSELKLACITHRVTILALKSVSGGTLNAHTFIKLNSHWLIISRECWMHTLLSNWTVNISQVLEVQGSLELIKSSQASKMRWSETTTQ